MSNRLAGEASPYLLQHRDNPVDWYPWGPAAIERAKAEQKPIFLSVGYSACHWCHVMAHESFESLEIADLLNEHFISIKVDREERPDLDQIYMTAVQLLTGRGGWPMSVFLTEDLEPFFGGTYWPPKSSRGMPGFDQVLHAIVESWQQRRSQIGEQATKLSSAIRQQIRPEPSAQALDLSLLVSAKSALEAGFDFTHGGFGTAPKFPHPMDLRLLLKLWQRSQQPRLLEMVELSLDQMAAGGIYDHLGGGFHRYSVDERWLVPHFEKMLYDNALLAGCYLDGYLATKKNQYRQIVGETLDYVLREMQSPSGGLFSTQDADSEGEEGKSFVWTPSQIVEILGREQATTFCQIYDITEAGNFEGRSILNLPKPISAWASLLGRDLAELEDELSKSRKKLLQARSHRVPPGLDDKVLVSWNGLMIETLARAGAVLGVPAYLDAARAASDFIEGALRDSEGRLLHCCRDGQTGTGAYLDDYAALLNAWITLYESTFDEVWLVRSVELAEQMLEFFEDREAGGFYFTARDQEIVIARQKELVDQATPSGNGLAAEGLLRLGKLTGTMRWAAAAERTLQSAAEVMRQMPQAAGQMLLALARYLGPTYELVIVGDPDVSETDHLLREIRGRFLPEYVLACSLPEDRAGRSSVLESLFHGRLETPEFPTLYVCENYRCTEPARGIAAARQRIAQLAAHQDAVPSELPKS